MARLDGAIDLELRDLDQAVVGSPAHDVVRLALSLAMAIRASGLAGATTLRAIESISHGYEGVLEAKVAKREFDLAGAPQPLIKLLETAVQRSRRALLEECVSSEKMIPIGKRFWPLTDSEREAVEKLVGTEKCRKLVTSLTSRADNARVKLLDAAYWVKGCSSLGLWRCAALLQVGDEKKASARALIDIKEAHSPVAPRAESAQLPKHDGERVVLGARALSPYLGGRMAPATLLRKPVFIREILPQDLKFELDALTDNHALELGRYLGSVVAIAHSRQLEPAGCALWLEEFRKEPAKNTRAPAWLWAAVVDLVALHEGAYLEHCREHFQTVEQSPAMATSDIESHHVSGD